MINHQEFKPFEACSSSAQIVKLKKEKIRENWKLVSIQLQSSKQTMKKVSEMQDSIKINKKRKNSDSSQINYLNSLKDLQVTKKFSDQFQLGKKIGEGSQSVIYQCFSRETCEKYIAKIIKNAQEETINMIIEHYRILRTLDYPSIIKGNFLYINNKEKITHMIMEYCSYPNLRSFMESNPGLHEKLCSQIIQKILKVLLYLHEKKVCHRDIKPQNILFDVASGNIKLIDFDIAKMPKYNHQKLQMWTNTGTLNYRAPQSFGCQYSQSIDIWAVGVIAYELLVGEQPFASTYVRQTIKQIKEKQIDWDSLDISPNSVDFLKKVLCRNSQERLTASQALSCPFILKYKFCKNTITLKTKYKKSLRDQQNHQKSDQQPEHSKFYNEEMLYNFRETINQDIGIRILRD